MKKVNVQKPARAKSLALRAAALAACLWLVSPAAPAQQPMTRQPAAQQTPAQQPAAQQPAAQATAAGLTAAQQATQKYFTDVELVNQHGRKMRLYSDLLKDRVVVINFFFATCKGSCPPMARSLQKVQDVLGDRMGKDAYIISMTVDPTVDTPAALKEYAAKVGARPGWHFITGEKANVDFALQKLGQYVENRENHTNIFIIGNERTGLWKKAFGLASAEDLNKVVESVLNDRPPGGR